MQARFLIGDTLSVLANIEPGSVDLVLSSPPFLALRSYLPPDHPNKALEIGSESTPADYLDTLLDVAEACSRVLAPHGSLVFELGDTFSDSDGAGGDYGKGGLRDGQNAFTGSARRGRNAAKTGEFADAWPLPKSLCGIPTLFAWSLAYGRNLLRPERTTDPWRIRNVVVWARPNPPVGALGDKHRPATSYVTVACKARDRYFDLDAVRGAPTTPTIVKVGKAAASRGIPGGDSGNPDKNRLSANPAGAPPLDYFIDDVFEIPTQPYSGSHYATWPAKLAERFIESMVPQRVCRVCGQPSRRIVEKTEEYAAARAAVGDFKADRGRSTGLNGTTQYVNGRHVERADVRTVGWTDCGCPGGNSRWRNGVVLDPFAGSGTTLAVATGHGRDAIGIDLDERNADLAMERVGMFLSVECEG